MRKQDRQCSSGNEHCVPSVSLSTCHCQQVKVKVKVKFALEQATKAQMGSRDIAVLRL